MKKINILLADDSLIDLRINQDLIQKEISKFENTDNLFNIETVNTRKDLFRTLREKRFQILVLDKFWEDEDVTVNSVTMIQTIKDIQPRIELVLLTSDSDVVDMSIAVAKGATNYLLKGNDQKISNHRSEVLKDLINRAIDNIEAEKLFQDNDNFRIKTQSPRMIEVLGFLKAIAPSPYPVLLLGDTGLGKTTLAKEINSLSKEAYSQPDRAFFSLNIAGIDESLLNSQLFGHEANSFTGSGNKAKQGILELSQNADVFFDEIGDASLETQKKILTVIEEKEFYRVGGSQKLKTNAKFIFATNKDLELEVKKGNFREDLYNRIKALSVQVPGLDERQEDISTIVTNLLNKILRAHNHEEVEYGKVPKSLFDNFKNREIPGNIRGIENELLYIVLNYNAYNPGKKINLRQWKVYNRDAKNDVQESNESKFLDISSLLEQNISFSENFNIKNFKFEFDKKLIKEATMMYSTDKQIADIFKVHPSFVTKLRAKTGVYRQ